MVAPASRRLSRGHLAFGGAAAMAAYSTIAHRFTRPHLNDRSASSWLSWIFHKNETRMGRLPPCSHRSAPEATRPVFEKLELLGASPTTKPKTLSESP